MGLRVERVTLVSARAWWGALEHVGLFPLVSLVAIEGTGHLLPRRRVKNFLVRTGLRFSPSS